VQALGNGGHGAQEVWGCGWQRCGSAALQTHGELRKCSIAAALGAVGSKRRGSARPWKGSVADGQGAEWFCGSAVLQGCSAAGV